MSHQEEASLFTLVSQHVRTVPALLRWARAIFAAMIFLVGSTIIGTWKVVAFVQEVRSSVKEVHSAVQSHQVLLDAHERDLRTYGERIAVHDALLKRGASLSPVLPAGAQPVSSPSSRLLTTYPGPPQPLPLED